MLVPVRVQVIYSFKERNYSFANARFGGREPYSWVSDTTRYLALRRTVAAVEARQAPVALRLDRNGTPLVWRRHGDRLYRDRGDRLTRTMSEHREAEAPGAPPVMTWGSVGWPFQEETEDDVAIAGWVRADAVDAALDMVRTSLVVIHRDAPRGGWLPVDWLRAEDDPLIVVVPPGAAGRSPSKVNKIPLIKSVLRPFGAELSEDLAAALRDDRLFRIDESAEAQERALQICGRIHKGNDRVDLPDAAFPFTDLSTMALRATGTEAVGALEGRTASDPAVEAARRALSEAVGDAGANAAAMCPPVRSFLASFGSSRETLALARNEAVAPYLDRLERAHARAQRRMAANRIPDRDPRALAPEDDIALAGLAH